MSITPHPIFNQQGTWLPISPMLHATCLQLYPCSISCSNLCIMPKSSLKQVVSRSTKRDECNKAILFANDNTGGIRVSFQFLHNIKIATSAIHETKSFQSKRHKHHPTDTEFPDIYSLHSLIGYLEITTNLTFIPNNTGPFELRTQHTVRLDRRSSVICNTTADDNVFGECAVWVTFLFKMPNFCSICYPAVSLLFCPRYSTTWSL